MGPLALERGGTYARCTIKAHAPLMLMVVTTVLVLVDLDLRWFRYHGLAGPTSTLLGPSLAAALIGTTGAAYGATLVFGYGFNVETSGTVPSGTARSVTCSPASPPQTDGACRAGTGHRRRHGGPVA